MCGVTVCRSETPVLDPFLFFLDKKDHRAVRDRDHGSRHRHTVTVYLVLVCLTAQVVFTERVVAAVLLFVL